jgi:hypothetical protein
MALDLSLMAIPDKGKFILQKAFESNSYACDLDKIQEPEKLKRHLEMVRKNPDGSSEHILNELIDDSEKIIKLYPNASPENYSFYSVNRCYDTINYLLTEILKEEKNELFLKYSYRRKFLYSGQDITQDQAEHVCFQFFDTKQTAEIYEVLNAVDFKQLVRHYDSNNMTEVYKLTSLDNFGALEQEFMSLREFYRQAKLIDGFVIIKIN